MPPSSASKNASGQNFKDASSGSVATQSSITESKARCISGVLARKYARPGQPAGIAENDGRGTNANQQRVGLAGVGGDRPRDGDEQGWLEPMTVGHEGKTVECGGNECWRDRCCGSAWVKFHHGGASSVGDEAQLARQQSRPERNQDDSKYFGCAGWVAGTPDRSEIGCNDAYAATIATRMGRDPRSASIAACVGLGRVSLRPRDRA